MFARFKVTQCYGREPERPIAWCVEQQDAVCLIEAKIKFDQAMKVVVKYRLYEQDKQMGEWRSDDGPTTTAKSTSQQPGAVQAFSPTPFVTAPRPAGGLPSSFRDLNADKDKK